MSSLQSSDYPGWGEWARENLYYTQAIRVENRIICSGQGGWTTDQVGIENLIKGDLLEEIDQAFKNVDYNLRHAGGQGWSQVYKVVTYSTDMKTQFDRILANFKKWMPNHAPVWTQVGVKMLGGEDMHFEIEVEAYDAEGAAAATRAKV